MALTASNYHSQLKALLPQGLAWARAPGSVTDNLMASLAVPYAEADSRLDVLVDEADPRNSNEMLTDWERVCGLPDTCLAGILDNITSQERRNAVVARLTGVGGLDVGYYISLIESLGYKIRISTFKPFTVTSRVNDPLYNGPWRFVWRVDAQAVTVKKFTVRSGVNDPLASWGNAMLECVINRLKPAHTHVIFAYGAA